MMIMDQGYRYDGYMTIQGSSSLLLETWRMIVVEQKSYESYLVSSGL
jgi:hypothetical protein